MATNEAEGRFKRTTDDGQHSGAAIGTNRIVLKQMALYGDTFLGRTGEDIDRLIGMKPRISRSDSDREETPWKVKVTAGRKNEIRLEETK